MYQSLTGPIELRNGFRYQAFLMSTTKDTDLTETKVTYYWTDDDRDYIWPPTYERKWDSNRIMPDWAKQVVAYDHKLDKYWYPAGYPRKIYR